MRQYRIGFVRQVFGTEWARRSHECIRRGFPDSMILELDGTPPKLWTTFLKPILDQCHVRRRAMVASHSMPMAPSLPDAEGGSEGRVRNPLWRLRQYLTRRFAFDPLRPVLRGLELPVDYLVHIDEDCFLLDAEQLWETINFMECHPEILLAGPADGGTPHREERNPFACNLFFNVMKRRAIHELVAANPDWRMLRFRDLPPDCVTPMPERGTITRPVACDEEFHLDDYEPYYALYWLILRSGYGIHYLPVQMTNDDRRASAIRLPGYRNDMCFHMWYVREWVRGSDLVVDGVRNQERYEHAVHVLRRQGFTAPLSGHCRARRSN